MNNKIILSLIALFISLYINKAYCLNNNSNNDISAHHQNLSDTILALDITREKYQSLLSAQNQSIKNNKIIKEYSLFVEYLSYKMNNYCEQLVKNYGKKSVQNLPCTDPQLISYDNQTTEEKIKSLDEELTLTLGEFDEMLLNEDNNIAQKSHKNKTQDLVNNLPLKNNSNRVINEQETNKKSSATGSSNKDIKYKNYKRKKLNEINDDIVARQLKEAAEKETNPKLQEKLWNEYYKYKKAMVIDNGTK